MSSIRLRLLKWLIGPILLINLAGASLTYLLAWLPAQQAFDEGLHNAVRALQTRLQLRHGQVVLDLPRDAERMLRSDDVDVLYYVVRARAGGVLAGDAALPAARRLPATFDGVVRGEAVRVAASLAQVGGTAVEVTVAKTQRRRQQARTDIVRAVVLLESIFTLVLVGLIWFSVTTGLRPLARMRANLNARDAGDLAPLESAAVPFELGPVVGAFNELLDKVNTSTRAQHDFLADVAHQLRTPLAGMRLQLEWLGQRHGGDADSVRSVGLMLQSNERMIRQTNQLLALARAEPSRFEKTRLEKLDLARLIEGSVQAFVEQAGKKRIDLGFELHEAPVLGDGFLLRDLIDNLVDNALRYTPEGGTVTVRCAAARGESVLVVEDSGPGIAPHLRGRVFQRYVRLDDKSAGNGLGLAIVRDVAQAHGAAITLGEGVGRPGLSVSVRFPPLNPGRAGRPG